MENMRTPIPDTWLMYAEAKGDSSDELRKYSKEQIQYLADKLRDIIAKTESCIEGSEYHIQQLNDYAKFDWMLEATRIQNTVYAVYEKKLS